MIRKTVSWNIFEGFLVLIAVNVLMLFFNFSETTWFKALSSLISHENEKIGQLFVASLFQSFVIVFFVMFVVIVKHKENFTALGIHAHRISHWIWSGIKSGIFIFLLVVLMGMIINLLFPNDIKPQKVAELIMGAKGWKQMLIPFIVTTIFAPISEEIYFRGFLYPAISKKLGKNFGMIITSLIFGGMHFDLIRLIPLALGGLWLNWLYEKSGSLVTNITAHAVWNLIMTSLLFLIPEMA